MNPALSVVFFTTAIGMAQGLVSVLALATLRGVDLSNGFLGDMLLLADALLLFGLACSFGHLGNKRRAWRAVLMWRTSWLSRECIVLPALIGWIALWWFAPRLGLPTGLFAIGALLLTVLLWYCTAMIYFCMRFIEEWAQPLTIVSFFLVGLGSGSMLASAAAVSGSQRALLESSGPLALLLTLAAWGARMLAMRRNARLRHRSTLQSATGIHAPNLAQKSMGMSAGAFNTREFFHGRTLPVLKAVKLALIVLGFALPALLASWALISGSAWPWMTAIPVQTVGLLADRWFFFAQAKHPQNLYYQVVS